MKGGSGNKIKDTANRANKIARTPYDGRAGAAAAPKTAAKSPREQYPGKAKTPSMPCKIKGLQTS